MQTILCVYKEEGFKSLFKGSCFEFLVFFLYKWFILNNLGLVPKILRFGPGGALMIVSYEEIYKYLKGNF